MATKIGILSDVHADAAYTRAALGLFKQHQVDRVLCAGDIAGYGDQLEQTVQLIQASGCEAVLGNHDAWYDTSNADHNKAVGEYLHGLPACREYLIEDRKVFMVHAHPPDACMGGIKLLDEYGVLMEHEIRYWSEQLAEFDYDVLIVGHTHQVFAEKLAGTLVINPGSTRFNYSCAILDLPGMHVEFIGLLDKPISRVWNWGAYRMTLE